MKLRFHLLGLPHVSVNPTAPNNACAYTMRCHKFCKMMTDRGNEVFMYGPEGADNKATENIVTINQKQMNELVPQTHGQMFNIIWDHNQPYWQIHNNNSIIGIRQRYQPKDIVLYIGGLCQKPVHDALSDLQLIHSEPVVGYSGYFTKFIVTESYAQLHKLLGSITTDCNGDFYKTVIPPFQDLDEFPYCSEKEDYFLYLGRSIMRKGIQIAVQTCREIGAKLLVAGQGVRSHKLGQIVGNEETYDCPGMEYVGVADMQKRAELFGKAKGFFCPTLYVEPGGNVSVESQLCGTPCISVPWGCMTENIEHGVSGYLCSTHNEFCWAAENIKNLSPAIIRQRAERLFSLQSCGRHYQNYYEQLYDIFDQGYYQRKKIDNLDYRRRDWWTNEQ